MLAWLAQVPVVGGVIVIGLNFVGQGICLIAQQPPEVTKEICRQLGVPCQ